jgi:hypothetical protein
MQSGKTLRRAESLFQAMAEIFLNHLTLHCAVLKLHTYVLEEKIQMTTNSNKKKTRQ